MGSILKKDTDADITSVSNQVTEGHADLETLVGNEAASTILTLCTEAKARIAEILKLNRKSITEPYKKAAEIEKKDPLSLIYGSTDSREAIIKDFLSGALPVNNKIRSALHLPNEIAETVLANIFYWMLAIGVLAPASDGGKNLSTPITVILVLELLLNLGILGLEAGHFRYAFNYKPLQRESLTHSFNKANEKSAAELSFRRSLNRFKTSEGEILLHEALEVMHLHKELRESQPSEAIGEEVMESSGLNDLAAQLKVRTINYKYILSIGEQLAAESLGLEIEQTRIAGEENVLAAIDTKRKTTTTEGCEENGQRQGRRQFEFQERRIKWLKDVETLLEIAETYHQDPSSTALETTNNETNEGSLSRIKDEAKRRRNADELKQTSGDRQTTHEN